LLCL